MNLLVTVVSFVLILGIMIFLHELGHFLACRFFGIRVEIFSLGFGKRLWGFKRGGVDFRVSLFPIGGYVKMAGEHIGEERSGDPDEFLSRPRHQRVVVMLAGPLMNILLAIFLVAFNYTVGIEVPAFYHQPATVGLVADGSPAARAGLQTGDEVLALSDVKIRDWADLQLQAISFSRQTVPARIKRAGRQIEVRLEMGETLMDPSEITGILPFIPAQVESVADGYPAIQAGVRAGDLIEEVTDGQTAARGYLAISKLIQRNIAKPLRLHIRREGQLVQMEAKPVASKEGDKRGVLGFTVQIGRTVDQYPLPEAVWRSLRDNYDFVILTYKILGKVITGQQSLKQFSGPIGIAQASGEAVQSRRITVVFSFMALISMNLAVLNLLPIPILDGGMIFLLLIEMALRRDLPMAFKERAIQVGFVLLVSLMVVVIFFDILKTFN